MQNSDKYKKRAVQLYKEMTADETIKKLRKEFADVPDTTERTLSRWKGDERYSTPDDSPTSQSGIAPLTNQNEKLLREHFEQMTSVAGALLGGLDLVEYEGGDNYEITNSKILKVSLNRAELVETLKVNTELTRQKYRSMGVFKHFLTHLRAERPSCRDLDRYIEEAPLELIELLKALVVKKVIKGVCPICKP